MKKIMGFIFKKSRTKSINVINKSVHSSVCKVFDIIYLKTTKNIN
jgi:hypothetical protein